MPHPEEGESEKDFLKRCIPEVMHHGTASHNKQAVAICFSIFRRDTGHGSPKPKKASYSSSKYTHPGGYDTYDNEYGTYDNEYGTYDNEYGSEYGTYNTYDTEYGSSHLAGYASGDQYDYPHDDIQYMDWSGKTHHHKKYNHIDRPDNETEPAEYARGRRVARRRTAMVAGATAYDNDVCTSTRLQGDKKLRAGCRDLLM